MRFRRTRPGSGVRDCVARGQGGYGACFCSRRRAPSQTGAPSTRQPSTLNPQPSTLNPQPSTLNPQPSTLNPQPSTLNPQPSTLNPHPQTPNPRPSTQIICRGTSVGSYRGVFLMSEVPLYPRQGLLDSVMVGGSVSLEGQTCNLVSQERLGFAISVSCSPALFLSLCRTLLVHTGTWEPRNLQHSTWQPT